MSNRLRFVLILTLILSSMTIAACNKERPVSTTTPGTPGARGTVAAPSAATPAITQVALPTAVGGSAASTPSVPSGQQAISSAAATARASGQPFEYTVAAGDTLLSIATRFGTTSEAIAELNSLTELNELTLGQTLTIPGATTAEGQETEAATTGSSNTYTVQQGDTLGEIAQRFDTTVQAIVSLNDLADADSIVVGQTLKLPAGGADEASTEPASGQGKTYVIQRGDTLMSIAREYGLTLQQLQDANNIADPDRIYPGQTLVIP
jgi:LysM repeat protein